MTFEKISHKKVLLYDSLVEVGTGVPCFTEMSETPLKVLTVKNVKLNVPNAFELR